MLVREAIEFCKLSLMGASDQSSEDQKAGSNAARKDQAQEVSLGMRTPLAAGLQSMCVILWQNICLHFAHVLRLCGRLRVVGRSRRINSLSGHSPHRCMAQGQMLLSRSQSLHWVAPSLLCLQKPQRFGWGGRSRVQEVG